MRQKSGHRFEARLWLREAAPLGAHVWAFKTNRMRGDGTFHSYQSPSGITLRVISRGRGTVNMSGLEQEVSVGSVFCAIPGVPIEFYESARHPWAWYEFQVQGAGAMDFVAACGCGVERPVVQAEEAGRVVSCFRRLHEYFGAARRDPYRALSLLYAVADACQAGRGHRAPRLSSRRRLVEGARAILESMASPRANVGELARRLGVDRTTLQRAFKREEGVSAVRFLKRLRIQKAQDLLRSTHLSLGAVGRAAGFSSGKYFIRCFREETGRPPGRWRRDAAGAG
ncbi:MAG: helix-turn-helix domain-containing protein [Kiritimatiellae bacterium]|nr:helix-turn-helix domain-containing protein [Kiritimatiellia bacterium]